MKTVTLKTDDSFFEKLDALAKELHLSKSELIRRSVTEYDAFVHKKKLKEQMRRASLRVREADEELMKELDALSGDGLEDV